MLVRPEGIEPPTLWSEARCSNPLSYGRKNDWNELVGARGFEPPTSSSRTTRATKLRYAPTDPPLPAEEKDSRNDPRATELGFDGEETQRRLGLGEQSSLTHHRHHDVVSGPADADTFARSTFNGDAP